MKTYEEIRQILTVEYGFSGLSDYQRWVQEVRPTITPTRELIDRLSPDGVDCRAFWRACDELFGLDPICNVTLQPSVGVLPYPVQSRIDANRMNLRLAKSMGITAFLEENAAARLKTLEVGTGFGSLKSFIESHTAHIYTGIDVRPRVPDVIEATAEGLIPGEFVNAERGQFAYVVSSNVFQHLSSRQRSRYYADIHRLLCDGGLLIFNLLLDTGKLPPCTRDNDGRAWCDHYCQFTPVPKPADHYAELAPMFKILYVTQRYDGLFNFVCQRS